MRKILPVFIALIAAAFAASAQQKGPVVDKVYFDVRMQQDIGMKDVAEGKSDVFWYSVQGPDFKALPKATRDKLDVYNVPSSWWSLQINPVPNKAPYTVTAKGKTSFNPFAVREIRYALNWLINRKYIVDEILGGEGGVMFTVMTPGQPGTYKYNLLASKLGMSPAGDEKKAITDITAAMQKASELPENRGKLAKKGQWWNYGGEPVTIKFLIRVDDPTGRLPEGRYISDQIEKAGIKVERLEYDRAKCSAIYSAGNPADYEWNIYTEGWSAGATRAFWDVSIAQMYSPWYSQMPGGSNTAFWRYTNDEIDTLSKKVFNGQFLDEAEYWDSNLKGTEIGLTEAVRVAVAYSNAFFVSNKDRFNGRMVYGVGDGLNDWSIRTADVKPERNGEKALRITQFSAKGSLFMYPLDPVGSNGFRDVYAAYIFKPLTDMETTQSPADASSIPWRADWKDVRTSVKYDKAGKLVGEIPVPPEAIMYDSASKSWKKVGPGITAFSKGTYTYKLGKWHSGQPMTVADVMYPTAFRIEWMNKDGDADKYYDKAFDSNVRPGQEIYKGIVVNADGSFTVYFNYNWITQDMIAAAGALPLRAGTPGKSYVVSWEINEALALMVAEGSKSGTTYRFNSDPGVTQVDVINPKCVDDIRAKLVDMKAQEYVPACIRDYIGKQAAMAAYDAAIRFIDEHKHAFISDGAFLLNRIDLANNFYELAAVRDASYPFVAGTWNRFFSMQQARVDAVNMPAMAPKNADAKVTVKLSTVDYPAGTAKPAGDGAKVKLTLVTPEGETGYYARFVKAGEYQVTIPRQKMSTLKSGSYTVVVEASLGDEAPASDNANLIVF